MDAQGNLQPADGSFLEYGTEKVFERAVKNDMNRGERYRETEKAKARMIRRLASAGFSQDAVLFTVRKIGEL